MMKITSYDAEQISVLQIANTMASAAKTAPKGLGINRIDTLILTEDDIKPIIEKMKKTAYDYKMSYFLRDAESLEKSQALVLIGTTYGYRGLTSCGLCGNIDCATNKKMGGICVFDTIDLGIAIGAACSVALTNQLDHRVFFSIAKAALDLGDYLPSCKLMLAIPVSTCSKNIYYDRKMPKLNELDD